MSIGREELTVVREDVIARGKKIYDERLRGEPVPDHMGCCAAIDRDIGRYSFGDTSAEAVGAAHDAVSDARFYLKRIGYPAVHSISGSPAGRSKAMCLS